MTSFSGDAFAEHMKAAAVQRDSYTTPAPTARKRTRHERNSSASTAPSEDKRDEMPANPLVALNTSRPATRNAAIAVKSFVKKQKLCGEQLIQLDSFLNVRRLRVTLTVGSLLLMLYRIHRPSRRGRSSPSCF